jgi:DNA-binding NarL/FixJ family response regulator
MIRVLVVDDHAILRDGIRSILESQKDIVVVGEADDGVKAVEYVKELQPDVVLMDLSMPRLNGLEATRLIKENYPQVKVLILTQYDNREHILPALRAGASGYVLKRSGRREMLNALRHVYDEGTFLANSVIAEVLQDDYQDRRVQKEQEQHLTDREQQVLQRILEGKSNKEIGLELGINPKTVSVHRTNIMAKFGVQNTIELMRAAARKHLVSADLTE